MLPLIVITSAISAASVAFGATQRDLSRRTELDGITVSTAAGGAACKSVATFKSSAVPVLKNDGCLGCHGGANPAAVRALDLSNVGKDDAAACAQALTKVNGSNKPQSAILQAVTGTQAHLGGKVKDAPVFTAGVMGWINNE
jgi:hypothetical protein